MDRVHLPSPRAGRAQRRVVNTAEATTDLRLGSTRMPSALRAAQLLGVQRSVGNQAAVVLQREFENADRAGSAPAEGTPIPVAGVSASPEPLAVNEFGEIDGGITSAVTPHVFKKKGKHGNALVNWAGGPGGAGEQAVGSITLAAPAYKTAAPKKVGKPYRAWIEPGTGTATVTRSFKGVQKGANATYWFTRRACSRADVHEKLHISSSKSHHDTNIKPLEARVKARLGKGNALGQGADAAAAQAALAASIDWNTSVTAFSTADTASNTPLGTVDTTDMARADFIRNYGARTVKGTNFASYIDTPPGP